MTTIPEYIKAIEARSASISGRFALLNSEQLSAEQVDQLNADDRERIHELAMGLVGAVEGIRPVLTEALGDAIAYRNDSGESADEDLEDVDLLPVKRYRALAQGLGLEVF